MAELNTWFRVRARAWVGFTLGLGFGLGPGSATNRPYPTGVTGGIDAGVY